MTLFFSVCKGIINVECTFLVIIVALVICCCSCAFLACLAYGLIKCCEHHEADYSQQRQAVRIAAGSDFKDL